MSRLEELIRELCPDGVEYVKLNTVCKIYDGTHSTPKYTDHGVKFVSVENINNLYATEKYISEEDYKKYKVTPQVGDILMTRIGSIGVCSVVERDEPLAYYVSLALLRPDKKVFNSRFLKYAIESLRGQKELRKRTLVNAVPIKVNKDDIGKILVPIPPLPVQCEIVRILDNFTELTAELTAELTVRKKQYEYYRDLLLTFDKADETVLTDRQTDLIWISLSDLFYTRNGYTPSKNHTEYWMNGNIPWFRMEDIRENGRVLSEAIQKVSENAVKGKPFPPDSIIVATSATIGEHALITVPSLANQRFTYLMLKEKYKELVDIKFIYYYCFKLDEYCKRNLNQGNFASVDMKKFSKFTFTIPCLDEQRRIVSILDRFDVLCNDLSSGLPAEIEARQKQYEYYRDRLLTFKPKETASASD